MDEMKQIGIPVKLSDTPGETPYECTRDRRTYGRAIGRGKS
ncbi:hypothetical protein [Oceanobacillus senegalensis]|nr:hypothetical protein [Oceanobacillus senegalensis]